MNNLLSLRTLVAATLHAVVAWAVPGTVFGADTTPPSVLSVTPAAGATLSNWGQIVVTFTEPVVGVDAFDLLINSIPATSVSNVGNAYYFTASQPAPGGVGVRFDNASGIGDLAGNLLDEAAAGQSWSYTLLDLTPPVPALIAPAPGAVVSRLEAVDVLFSEAVSGVDATDLLVNGLAATSVTGAGSGPYHFQFPAAGLGVAQLNWAAGHGIADLASVPNAFAGGAWSNTVVSAAALGSVLINEFLANNVKGLSNEFGSQEDWIELYNPGPASVNLLGWSLTDDSADPGLWTFPSVTLSAGQYLVVFADALDLKTYGGTNRLHTSFKLNEAGGYLGLFNADAPRTAMTEFTNNFPEQRPDYSYGRSGTNGWAYFATPTPGATNGASSITNVAPLPHVSAGRGLYDQPFTLVAACDLPGAALRYTTDGSPPTEANGLLYAAPLTVSNTTVFRVAAFATNRLPSRVLTHSYIFPAGVIYQPNNPAGYPTTWGVFSVNLTNWTAPGDYEMDPEIVTQNPANVKASLAALPTLAVTMKIDDLLGPVNGIYTHPVQGDAQRPLWERACSAEFIETNGQTGFHLDCGIRMQGNASRSTPSTPKHPFRLMFRGAYGPGRLDYPIYDGSPVASFDTIVLRADYNNSWTHWDTGQRARGNKVRDAWGKATFRAMNGLAGHSRPFHLYLNGIYWGVYDFGERVDANFAASYLGGAKDDYDAIASKSIKAIDGDLLAFNTMTSIGRTFDMTQPANYTLFQQRLDLPNFIDYMILNFYGANQDWNYDGNWNAFCRRAPGATFKYSPWDGEQLIVFTNDNRVTNPDVPSGLHTNLIFSSQYKMDFADRVHRYCFNNGILTPGPAAARWMDLAHQVELGMLAESARWGDYRRDVHQYSNGPYDLYTTNAYWWPEIERMRTTYFPVRTTIFLSQLRGVGLYPNVAAPVFSQFGGRVARGYALTMSATNTVYYTTNGTDPRVAFSGAISSEAILYTGALTVSSSVLVQARALFGTNWSALNAASFEVAALAPLLHITEIMYNPQGGDAYEFLELRNDGLVPLDVGLWTFEGISFTFPAGTLLAPGQFIVLANNANPTAFAARYPGVSVLGWFGGKLDNNGERIAIHKPTGEIVLSVDYGDSGGWPKAADGSGYSLEIMDPNGDPDAPSNWRATSFNGTPGTGSTAPLPGSVRLNEIMAENVSAVSNSSTFPDWVELTSSSDADLSSWSLSDDSNTRKFVFPAGTTISAGGFLVVWCDTNAALPGLHAGFALDKSGGTVSLFDAATNRADALTYGLQLPDLSLGRVGGDWVLTQPTPNATNLAAVVGSQTNLFINEWLANAAPGGSDWIELFNAATNPVPLRGLWLATSNSVSQLAALSFLAPHGYLQLLADEQAGVAHLDFKLPSEGSAIILYDNTATERSRVTYGPQTEGISQGRLPDGAATITNFVLSPSPGTSNYVLSYTGPVLNEVMARNRTTAANSAGHFADWVELFNPLGVSFDLSGYRLSTAIGNSTQWTFPAGVVIPTGGYLLVWFDSLSPASLVNGSELNTSHTLDADSDEVYLFTPTGLIADSVQFGPQAPDLSIGRAGGAWTLLATPTPEAANAANATLGSAAGLRLNEWLAAAAPGQSEFFEVFNTNAQPVDLGGLYLTDDLSAAGLKQFQIAPLSYIAPLGFTEFKADSDPSQGRNHVNFSLDSNGESLRLSSTNLGIIDTVAFGLQTNGISQGRFPDGSTNITSFTFVSPGSANSTSAVVVIIVPPRSLVAALGGSASFTVSAFGGVPFSYQWFFAGAPITGATAATLSLSPLDLTNAGSYFVVVTNSLSSATSAVATLTVLLPPHVTADPSNLTVVAGGAASFSVTASGSAPLSYQWYFRGQPIAGATSDTLTLAAAATSNAGPYQVVVSNPVGTATSATATLAVLGPPWIFAGPTNQTVIAGQPAAITVDAAGNPAPSYQWFFQGQPVPGVVSNRFVLSPAAATNAGSYQVVVSNDFGAVTSALATLTVLVPPAIVTNPTNVIVLAGAPASFSVEATGTAPLSYRWFFQGQLIPSAISNRLAFASVAVSNGGAYQVIVTNAAGQATSSVATLTVLVPLTITNQPASLSVWPYTNITLTVGVSGALPIYQWRLNGTNLPNATNASLAKPSVLPADAGTYTMLVTNSISSVTSAPAVLTVWTNPLILTQPISRSAVVGSNATFTVVAASSSPLRYQWLFNTTNTLAGATNDTLTFTNVQTSNYGFYHVRVADSFGLTNSDFAQLADKLKPTITEQPTPTNTAILVGTPLTFSASAIGPMPLSFRWRRGGATLTNAIQYETNSTYSIPGGILPNLGAPFTNLSASFTNGGRYDVVVTNTAGSAPSSTFAYLTVMGSLTNQAARPGSNVTFTFMACGFWPISGAATNALRYQWWFNETNLLLSMTNPATMTLSLTNVTLSLTNVQLASEGAYKVVLNNNTGLSATQTATLTILRPPSIVQQPSAQTVLAGTDVSLEVAASGSGPLGYLWQHDGAPLTNAAGPSLFLAGVQTADAGGYRVVVTNSEGSVTSAVAVLTVQTYQLTGQVELESYLGPAQNGYGTRVATFTATDNDNHVLARWDIPLDLSPGLARAGVASFTLTNVPPATANLSAKTAWHLRKRLAVAFTGFEAVANFNGASRLPAGDLDGSNWVDLGDYAQLAAAWYTSDPAADLDGSGLVDILDYFTLASHWAQPGDPE